MPGATSAEPQQVLMYRYITEFTITIHCLQIEINISTFLKNLQSLHSSTNYRMYNKLNEFYLTTEHHKSFGIIFSLVISKTFSSCSDC